MRATSRAVLLLLLLAISTAKTPWKRKPKNDYSPIESDNELKQILDDADREIAAAEAAGRAAEKTASEVAAAVDDVDEDEMYDDYNPHDMEPPHPDDPGLQDVEDDAAGMPTDKLAVPQETLDAEFSTLLGSIRALYDRNATDSQAAAKDEFHTKQLLDQAQRGGFKATMALAYRSRFGVGHEQSCPLSYHYYFAVADQLVRELEKISDGRDTPLSLDVMRLSSWELDGILGEDEDDLEEALAYDAVAAEGGDIWAQKELGWRSLLGRGMEQNHGEAMGQFEQAAAAGDGEALHNLGYMHLQGLGVPVNHTKAASYFRQAAAMNISQSFNALGYLYFRGDGLARNLTEAEHFFSLALRDGDADAAYNLALLYEERDGNLTKAAEFFRQASGTFHWRGMVAWAEVQYRGIGTNVSCQGAVKTLAELAERHGTTAEELRQGVTLYKKGAMNDALLKFESVAEQGVEVAQANVAFMLQKPPLNMTLLASEDATGRRAARYLRLAMQQGSADAAYRLGNLYWDGVGAPANATLAAQLYLVAANNGSAEGALALGYLYQWGQGVDKNLSRALELYRQGGRHATMSGTLSHLPSLLAQTALSVHIFVEETGAMLGVEVQVDANWVAMCLATLSVSSLTLLIAVHHFAPA